MGNKVVVFGEILFDIIDKKEYIGGAPFNFSYYLKNLGVDVIFISAVGNDERGKRALKIAEKIGLNTSFIDIVDFPTGIVNVRIKNGKVSFDIMYPCAWDYIKISPDKLKMINEQNPKFFYFGSLAMRSECSFNTFNILYSTLKDKINFCDINLRKPFYNKEIIKNILTLTDILKLNEEEVDEISEIFGFKGDIKSKILQINKNFKIPIICTTMGEKGAIGFLEGKFYFSKGEKVKVIDTVGAGDAFAAGFLKGLMEKFPYEKVLSFANKLGAKASSTKGAIPISFNNS